MSRLGRQLTAGVAAGVLVVIGAALYADAAALARALGAFEPLWLVPALGLVSVGYAVRVWKWDLYLRRLGVALPKRYSATLFVAGMVMGITPAKVGEVLKSFLLKQSHGVPVAHTAPIVIAERLTDLIALLVLTVWGVVAFGRGHAVVYAVAALTVGGIALLGWPRPARAVLRWTGRVPILQRATPTLERAYESMLALLGLRLLTVTALLSVVAWSCEATATWLLINAFPGADATWGQATFVFALSTIAGAVSMLPGGLGLTEGSMIGLLYGAMHVTPSKQVATAATLVVRFCTLWYGVLLGGGALASLRRRGLSHAIPGEGPDAPLEPGSGVGGAPP